MSSEGVFACPSCGASLSVEGEQTYVKCGYCGNTVIVPEELRSRRVTAAQVDVPVVMMQLGDVEMYPARRRGNPLLVVLLIIFLLGIGGVAMMVLTMQK